MATFKDSNVQNLKQYRTAFPEQIMPRILLVIDEFQLMFSENDSISYEIAKLLMKGARLFRAAGIHILLSSQTIGGNNALMGSDAEGLFGQVPIRLALKNSISESYATLGQQNDAAAHLRSREAIVNLDYGNIASNMKTSIAFADELVLEPLRKVWWKSAMKVKKYPFPNVFIGSQKISLSRSNIESLREHNRALMVVGTKVSVSSAPLTLPLIMSLVETSYCLVMVQELRLLEIFRFHWPPHHAILDFLSWICLKMIQAKMKSFPLY